jgi:hypothetical protein
VKLSTLIREYIDLKIEGPPAYSDWRSIDEGVRLEKQHRDSLACLENQIDALVALNQKGLS